MNDDDLPKLFTKEDLYRKVAFGGRQHGPKDFFKLAGKVFRYLLIGTLVVGQLTISLWHKHERLPGATRQWTYVETIEKGRKHEPIILAGWVAFGTSGTYGRDAYLPGWNTSGNVVDCIGGGGGGGGGRGGGGGGGGLARYSGVGALGATFTISVGGGGAGSTTNGGAGGNTQLDGWVGAYGGGGGLVGAGGGGAGGTYYAGTGYYAGGAGYPGTASIGNSGGGGGAAGYYGGGSNSPGVNGGNGGPSGGGGGGAGSAGAGAAGNGGNGTEYGSWGSGGGGGGRATYAADTVGGNGGYYGGGGGGGNYYQVNRSGGPGAQGLLMMYYVPLTAPVVSSCTPNIGSTAGGTSVTISGSGFINVASVTFGGAAATSVAVPNANTITCVTPAHAVGVVNITVNVTGGVAAGNGISLFTYVTPPSVSSCAPNAGSTLGGTPVTINGADFVSVTSVTFGGTAATSVVVVNSGMITCIAPAHAEGLVSVLVSSAVGGTAASAFTYRKPSGGFNKPMLGF